MASIKFNGMLDARLLIRAMCLVLGIAELLASGGCGQSIEDSNPAEAARKTLAIFSSSKESRRRWVSIFGRSGAGLSPEVGEPLEDFMIRLDELQKFNASSDPAILLHSTETVLFPVIVQNVRTAVLAVGRSDGAWRYVYLEEGGSSNSLFAARDKVRREKASSLGELQSEMFVMRVPSIGLDFLGQRKDGSIVVTPQQSEFGLVQGNSLDLAEAVRLIQPVARQQNGYPI